MPSHTTSHPDPALVRESWLAYDNLIAKAFAVQKTPVMSEAPSSTQLETLRALDVRSRSRTQHAPSEILSPEDELEPVWDAVRRFKAKQLAALPSKVKSLEGMEIVESESQVVPEVSKGDEKKLKRKASAILRETPDGRMATALFDMSGVHRKDMHVSYKGNRIVVTWRRVRVVETMEDGVKVRERKEKQYNQTIPLPEGTQFNEIRAARNGEYLMLTFPNLRCVKVDTVDASTTAWSSGETDFMTCEVGTMLDFEVFSIEQADSMRRSSRRS